MDDVNSPASQDDIDQLLGNISEGADTIDNSASDSVASILGQNDIDQLISGVAFSEPVAEAATQQPVSKSVGGNVCVIKNFGERIDVDARSVVKHDFSHPNLFSELEMEHLKKIHEGWLPKLMAHLSMLLRMDFSISLKDFSVQSYQSVLKQIPTPTHIFLYKISSLNGIGLFAIDVRLVMTVINRMLGGKAHSAADDRFLTEIEKTLINDVINVMLNEWCLLWKELMGPLTMEQMGIESSTKFIGNNDKTFSVLSIELDGALGDCMETIRMVLPCSMLQPIVEKLREHNKSIAPSPMVHKKIVWRNAYEDIKVPLVAEWNAYSCSVAELVKLKAGEIIHLPSEILKKTEVKLRNKTKFVGEVGLQNGYVAVKLLEKIKNKYE